MTALRFALLAPIGIALALSASAARADEPRPPDSSLPQPTPPGTPGTTTVVAPPASGGVTVVAPTPGGGQVTASGCTTVVVQGAPTLVGPGGGPCPTYAPYQPYQPNYYQPPPSPAYEVRPKYARDNDRKAALLASSLFFGIGGGVAGIAYLVQHAESTSSCGRQRYDYLTKTYYPDDSKCNPGGARVSLLTYGAIVTLVPSIPRFVLGDNTRGLIYTGLRGAAFATAALVDWGSNGDTKWQGPFLLGFVAPVTLGIIDLATTPHREDLEEAAAQPPKTGVTDVSPVAMTDRNGKPSGAVLSVSGLF